MSFIDPIREKVTLIRVNNKFKCPICLKNNWCIYADNGAFAICMRLEAGSVKRAKNNGFIHLLKNLKLPPITIRNEKPQSPKASISHLHKVYSFFLAQLYLNHEHTNNLMQTRGLKEKIVLENQYKSMPTDAEANKIVSVMVSQFGETLLGIPGFYKKSDIWQMLRYDGILLPSRNINGQIHGMQIRKDLGDPRYLWFSTNPEWYLKGTSSGAPPHFSHPNLNAVLYLTEGVLKADVISNFTQSPVIGVAGVSTTPPDLLVKEIKKLRSNASKVIIVFDSDWKTNKFVLDAILRIGKELASNNFNPIIRTWQSIEKGYDDVLLSNPNTPMKDFSINDFEYLHQT